MGWVFSAFTFAYAAFEIPSGWLGDVIRTPKGAGAHRPVVVGVHGGHGRGVELRFAR